MDIPLFQIGVIADVQYADLENGHVEGRCQRYREAPEKLDAALVDLCKHKPNFILHLGDIINGGATLEATRNELELIATIFDKHTGGASNIPAVFVIGNHCLDAGRSRLMNRLNIPEPGYYTRQLPHKWRLIVLDTTEISGKNGYPSGSWQYKEAREYEQAHPLSEKEPQMSPWNGGLSKIQLEWLQNELKIADASGEKIIIGCHHQFGCGAARPTHMAWNWKEIESVCMESASVCLLLAGHDHTGGFAEIGLASGRKKYAVTMEGLLEAPADSNAYGMLKVFDDRIEIEGKGTVTSRKLLL